MTLTFLVVIIIIAIVITLITIFLIHVYRRHNQEQFIADKDPINGIDAVITYVDSSDNTLADEIARFKRSDWNKNVNSQDSAVANRFRSSGELRYCLRSIEQYAPWIRTVYLIVAKPSQVPKWLNIKNPKLKIVTHDQFIPSKYLPTFNSFVIEAHFHRIKNISQQFLDFNDDMFLCKDVYPEDFISDQGKTYFYPDQTISPSGLHTAKDSGFDSMWKNVNEWLDIHYGKKSRPVMLHAPYVINIDVVKEIWQMMQKELDETSRHRFRHFGDYGLTCALHPWISLYEGKGEPKKIKVGHVELTGNIEHDRQALEKIIPGEIFCFVINDSDASLNAESTRLMIENLERIFPVESSFEIRHEDD